VELYDSNRSDAKEDARYSMPKKYHLAENIDIISNLTLNTKKIRFKNSKLTISLKIFHGKFHYSEMIKIDTKTLRFERAVHSGG